MRKLRNIYYLRLGSKIRQGFAVTTLSLTLPLSLPLSGCRGKQMRGEGEGNPFIQDWGACRPVDWRQGACRPPGGRQAPAKGSRANNFFLNLHISPCRPAAGLWAVFLPRCSSLRQNWQTIRQSCIIVNRWSTSRKKEQRRI